MDVGVPVKVDRHADRSRTLDLLSQFVSEKVWEACVSLDLLALTTYHDV